MPADERESVISIPQRQMGTGEPLMGTDLLLWIVETRPVGECWRGRWRQGRINHKERKDRMGGSGELKETTVSACR